MAHKMFLFGAAERGEYCLPVACHSLPQLLASFGHPPQESEGLIYAIQTLLYERKLYYFRVEEEGFSLSDYHHGLRLLRKKELKEAIGAICMPGVGDSEIIEYASSVCNALNSILIVTEKDLYDFLTLK